MGDDGGAMGAAERKRPATSSTLVAPHGRRDLRLDFFRGLALIFIFFDHIPGNLIGWLTVRNYAFSDATEMFIFISGYSAALAYGGALQRQGFLVATAKVLRRCWQLYIAHIFLFVIFTAQIAYVAHNFRNPMFVDEMGIVGFLNEPYVALGQALLLKFKPANMDVLPLYIALLLVFPFILWGLYKNSTAVLAASVALYVLQWYFDWNLPSYPDDKGWFFNPFAWQVLFVFGALCGRWRGTPLWPWLPSRAALALAIAYIIFAFLIVMTWHFPRLAVAVPTWLAQILYPIDKTDLDLLRLLSFLALAYVTVRYVPDDAAFLNWRIAAPLIRCGRHSLHVFCLGIFLSFAGHLVLTEVSGRPLTQILVNAVGVGLLVGMAYLLSWYKAAEAPPRPVAATPQRSEAS
jgi:hypothetical protein